MARRARFSVFRKIAVATWPRPVDPLIRVILDVDASAALDYIQQVRRATGVHVTLTHLVGRAAALAIATMPEINGRIVASMVLPSPTIDVFFVVSQSGELGDASEALTTDTSGVVIRRVDEKPPWVLAEEMTRLVYEIRTDQDPAFRTVKAVTWWIPAPLLGRFLRAASLVSEGLGIRLPLLGVAARSFGSIGVSSVGHFGIQTAFAPMSVLARGLGAILIGAVQPRPVAENGKVVIRPILPLSATVDHRMMDGYQGALLAREVRRYLLAPAERDPIPARPRRGRDTAAVHRDAAEAPATEQPSVH